MRLTSMYLDMAMRRRAGRRVARKGQTQLDEFVSFYHTPRGPCLINELPLELLQAILVYTTCQPEAHTYVHDRYCALSPFVEPPSAVPDQDNEDDGPQTKAAEAILADILKNVNAEKVESIEEWNRDLLAIADVHARAFATEPTLPVPCQSSCSAEPWNWLEVMRTCKLWEKAAHGCPAFHSRMALQNHAAMQRSLALSKSCPVRVHFVHGLSTVFGPDYIHDLLQLALKSSISRVAEVNCVLESSQDVASLCSQYLNASASSIYYLRLRRTHTYSDPVINLDSCFGMELAQLREVDAQSMLVTPACPLFARNVISIKLIDVVLRWPSETLMLDCLSRAPLLEVLELIQVHGPILGRHDQPPMPPSPPLFLSRLQYLRLEASCLSVVRFLDCVRFNDSTTLYLQYIVGDIEGEDAGWTHALNELVPQFYSRQFKKAFGADMRYTHALLTVDPYESASFTFTTPNHVGSEDVELPSFITFVVKANSYPWPDNPNDIVDAVAALLQSIPCGLTKLAIRQHGARYHHEYANIYAVPWESWWYACLNLSQVTDLSLEGDAAFDVMNWIQHRWLNGMPTAFPQLRILTFRNEALWRNIWQLHPGHFEIFVGLRALGHTILCFDRCEFDEQSLRQLQKGIGESVRMSEGGVDENDSDGSDHTRKESGRLELQIYAARVVDLDFADDETYDDLIERYYA